LTDGFFLLPKTKREGIMPTENNQKKQDALLSQSKSERDPHGVLINKSFTRKTLDKDKIKKRLKVKFGQSM